MTILIVEDDRIVRRLLATMLRQRGYDVRVAPSGHAAIHFLCAVRPDVVVLDLFMPDVNGVVVLEMMKQRSARGATFRSSSSRAAFSFSARSSGSAFAHSSGKASAAGTHYKRCFAPVPARRLSDQFAHPHTIDRQPGDVFAAGRVIFSRSLYCSITVPF